jgi:peptide/nickel transport system substrate-binding protein
VVPEPTHWTVGLLDQPGTLLPFSPDGRAAAPLVEAMFPAPALALGYSYTTTGVLEELPTWENAGLERRSFDGFLDTSGQFTTTATMQPTTTDQLVATFRWNRSLRWADGTPLTAHDSVFAYEEARRIPATPEMAGLLDLIETYTALDDYTTQAVLKPGQIDPSYPLTAWTPLPRHILADAPPAVRDRYTVEPLGYGPYTFGGTDDSTITLHRNPHWPNEELPDELRFRFFRSASALADAATSQAVDVAVAERIAGREYAALDRGMEEGAYAIAWLPSPVHEHLQFNLAVPALQDVRVRQAVALAMNRQGIARDILGGKVNVLHSWVLPAQHEYAGDEQLARYSFAPDRARALLDAAGFADRNGDGFREAPDGSALMFTLHTTDTEPRLAIADRIADDLRAVGLAVETQPLPTAQLYAPTGPLYQRTFQLALFGWLARVDPGGQPLWSCTAIPGADNAWTGNNFGGWCFEEAERTLRAATSTLDGRERAIAYLRHQQTWTRELPDVPLFQRPMVVLHATGIEGIVPDALAPITWNVDDWRR